MRRIDVRKGAQKFLRNIPTRDAKRISVAMQELRSEPYPPNSLKLKEPKFAGAMRLRVGVYRVIYFADKDFIFVEQIAHRKDAY